MTVNFEFVNIDKSDALCKYTEERLEKLASKFEFLISAQVYIKQEDNNHNAGKICNIELSLPGPRIFATSNEAAFETAVNETINDLTRQLKKRKETFKTH